MFKCPKCGNDTAVSTGRWCEDEFIRMRKCKSCRNIFYTREIVQDYDEGYDKMCEYWRLKKSGSKVK